MRTLRLCDSFLDHKLPAKSAGPASSRRPLMTLVRRGLNLRAAANAPHAESLSATQFPEDALHSIAPENLIGGAASGNSLEGNNLDPPGFTDARGGATGSTLPDSSTHGVEQAFRPAVTLAPNRALAPEVPRLNRDAF